MALWSPVAATSGGAPETNFPESRSIQTQFHLIPIARRFITQLLFTGPLATVGDCSSPVFRCSEITSSLRARAMRMLAEMRPSPGWFK